MHKNKKSDIMNLSVAFTELPLLPANGQQPKPSSHLKQSR